MHTGTVNLCGQIVMNTLIEEKINNEIEANSDMLSQSFLLKDLFHKLVDSNYIKKKHNQLHKPNRIELNQVEQNDWNLILNQNLNFVGLEFVEQSNLAWFNRKSENTFHYLAYYFKLQWFFDILSPVFI